MSHNLLAEQNNAIDISDIMDNSRTDEKQKRMELINFLCIKLHDQKDFELNRILNRIQLPYDFNDIITELRVWCSEHHMSLYSVKPYQIDDDDILTIDDDRV